MRANRIWVGLALVTLLLATAGCASQSGAPAAPAPPSQPAAAPAAPAAPATPYYQGKTIKLLVPYAPGGTTDVVGRLVAAHLGKSLAGSPQVLVENKAGGDGAIAFNHTFSVARPDGLTLVISSSGIPQRWLQGDQGHDYDLRQMPIHGAFVDSNVFYISTKAAERLGIKSAQDLVQIQTPISVGQIDKEGILNVIQELIELDTKIPFKTVAGYKSFGEVLLAVLGGEVDMGAIAMSGYAAQVSSHVKDGNLIPLFQGGVFDANGKMVRDPRLPDVPTYAEVYAWAGAKTEGANWQGIKTAMEMYGIGWALYSPPRTPAEMVADLNRAFEAATASPEFLAEARAKLRSEPNILLAAPAAKMLESFVATPRDVIQTWKAAVADS